MFVIAAQLFRSPRRVRSCSLALPLLAALLGVGGLPAQAPSGLPSPTSASPANSAPVPIQTQTPTPTVPGTRTLNGQTQTQTQTQDQSQTQTNPNDSNRRTRDDRTQQQQQDDANRRESTAGIAQEQPTPFQRLVAESTGTTLPIFGASLFQGVPSTFAPVDDIPVSPDYVLGPGDELRVQVYGQLNQQGTLRRRPHRRHRLPERRHHPRRGRPLRPGSRPSSKTSSAVSTATSTSTLISASFAPCRSLSSARRAGPVPTRSVRSARCSTHSSPPAVRLPQGSLRDIQLLRSGATVIHFDLYDLLLRGDKTHDVPLMPGDVLFIPVVGPQVALAGSVNNPAIYEIAPGTTVSQLLQLAGGRTSVAVGTQVRLERIFEHTMRSIVDVPLSPGHDPMLADGDILSVGAILDKYGNAVTLRGNVTAPGRYVWHPGMRIIDLVPSRDQLITRDYYARRNALGNSSADYSQPPGGALQLRGNGNTADTANAVAAGASNQSSRGGNSLGEALTTSNNVFGATTDLILSGPDLDWSYAVIERLNAETLTTSLIPFNPGALYLHGDQTQNLELLAGDVITFFSTADIKVPTSQQTRNVRLEGEFVASGVYSVEPGETLRHLLTRAGGLTPERISTAPSSPASPPAACSSRRLNEYADNLEAQIAVISSTANARATSALDSAAASAASIDARESIARLRRLVPIGRIVLELKPDSRVIDDVPDLPLEDGDRFVVPRTPSTVSVEGQVYSANAFVFERGHKESDYLRKAGGPDRQADKHRAFILRADGSIFSSQYGNVSRATIFPGDTIVMPPQLDRRAVLRNLLDISNIVGQFGLGAAAVTVLK